MEPFLVARNPEPDSRLPYPVRLPVDGGIVLKVKDTWPRASRVFCHPADAGWEPGLHVMDEAAVLICRRRGAAIDLVRDRPALARSQFIFTEARAARRSSGRPKRPSVPPTRGPGFPKDGPSTESGSSSTPGRSTATSSPAGRWKSTGRRSPPAIADCRGRRA
ncbi:MAG: hypothetical protein ACT4OM_13705 [Actinomycetota bacterium]